MIWLPEAQAARVFKPTLIWKPFEAESSRTQTHSWNNKIRKDKDFCHIWHFNCRGRYWYYLVYHLALYDSCPSKRHFINFSYAWFYGSCDCSFINETNRNSRWHYAKKGEKAIGQKRIDPSQNKWKIDHVGKMIYFAKYKPPPNKEPYKSL